MHENVAPIPCARRPRLNVWTYVSPHLIAVTIALVAIIITKQSPHPEKSIALAVAGAVYFSLFLDRNYLRAFDDQLLFYLGQQAPGRPRRAYMWALVLFGAYMFATMPPSVDRWVFAYGGLAICLFCFTRRISAKTLIQWHFSHLGAYLTYPKLTRDALDALPFLRFIKTPPLVRVLQVGGLLAPFYCMVYVASAHDPHIIRTILLALPLPHLALLVITSSYLSRRDMYGTNLVAHDIPVIDKVRHSVVVEGGYWSEFHEYRAVWFEQYDDPNESPASLENIEGSAQKLLGAPSRRRANGS